MKCLLYICIFLLLVSVACGRRGENSIPDSSEELFQKSIDLINLYTDSISNAKDSLELHTIVRNFNWKITNLNYDFPPDTDLRLSEEENDSLIKLFKNFESVRLRRDSVIMNKIPVDTLNTISPERPDSV